MEKLEHILSIILHSGELLEEEMKRDSNLQDLTSRQLVCIELVREMHNPSLSELAEKMKIAKASISVMIDRLEKKGLLHRVPSDNDRRTAHVHLSVQGERAASLHKELHKRIAEILTGEMTDSEKQILMVLLNKSVKSLTSNL